MEDKYSPQKKYAKKNIKNLGCSFNKDFVDEFNAACAKLNVKKAQLIKELMQKTIDQAKEQE